MLRDSKSQEQTNQNRQISVRPLKLKGNSISDRFKAPLAAFSNTLAKQPV